MTTTEQNLKPGDRVIIEVGQRWRTDDGYICDVVALDDEWAYVRHPNQKRPGAIMTRLAWFDHWTLIRGAA